MIAAMADVDHGQGAGTGIVAVVTATGGATVIVTVTVTVGERAGAGVEAKTGNDHLVQRGGRRKRATGTSLQSLARMVQR
mmetsp:Transcript_25165/g.56809  ORF Transcript_25165/g.56809 Transcript_25165/m.56809 type:complete len:80 (-) Transcript_25165:2286-2525(-)